MHARSPGYATGFQGGVVFQGGAEGAHFRWRALRSNPAGDAGQADNLGGGIFSKRLSKNRYRSIIVAKGGRYWVYAYLVANQDRANIENDELEKFWALADLYAGKTDADIAKETRHKDLVEICHGCEA